MPAEPIDAGALASYALFMEVTFPSDLEDKLSRLASRQGRHRDALVVEAVARLVDHDAWFAAEVDRGLAQIESGQTLSHEDVGTRLRKHLAAGPSGH